MTGKCVCVCVRVCVAAATGTAQQPIIVTAEDGARKPATATAAAATTASYNTSLFAETLINVADVGKITFAALLAGSPLTSGASGGGKIKPLVAGSPPPSGASGAGRTRPGFSPHITSHVDGATSHCEQLSDEEQE